MPDPTPTPVQGLVSIGIDIKINNVSINNVTDFSDIGGSKTEHDNTNMKDTVKKTKYGLKELKPFEVTYLYDNTASTSDYRVLKALESSTTPVPVEVEFPDGTVFATTGFINNVITGAKVDALLEAKVSVALQSDWTVTNPA